MLIKEKLINLETGEEQLIEREETADEKFLREDLARRIAIANEAKAEAAVKRSAALAKLEALGLDEDDLKALGL